MHTTSRSIAHTTSRATVIKGDRPKISSFFLMLLFGKLRKIHPILSSLTSTPPTPGASIGDVNRNLVSSLFLEFLNSFVNGKLVKTSTKNFRRPSDKCQEGALAPKCDQATTKKSTGSHHHMVRPAFPPSVEVQPSFCSF